MTVLQLVLVNEHMRSYALCRGTCCLFSVNVVCSKNQDGALIVRSNELQHSVCVSS